MTALGRCDGAGDVVVPVAAMEELKRAIEGRGARVSTHETHLFDHVRPAGKITLSESWPLLEFIAEALDAAGL